MEGVSTVNVARAKGQDVSTGKIGGMYVCMNTQTGFYYLSAYA